jgi:hypothetical protein
MSSNRWTMLSCRMRLISSDCVHALIDRHQLPANLAELRGHEILQYLTDVFDNSHGA